MRKGREELSADTTHFLELLLEELTRGQLLTFCDMVVEKIRITERFPKKD